MRVAAAFLAVTSFFVSSGCGGAADPAVPGASAAEAVARDYLRAGEARDSERLCRLRTERAVQRLGGQGDCLRKLKSVRPDIGPDRRSIEPSAQDLVSVAPTGGRAGAFTATVDIGGGSTVAELELRVEKRRYKVDTVGLAVSPD